MFDYYVSEVRNNGGNSGLVRIIDAFDKKRSQMHEVPTQVSLSSFESGKVLDYVVTIDEKSVYGLVVEDGDEVWLRFDPVYLRLYSFLNYVGTSFVVNKDALYNRAFDAMHTFFKPESLSRLKYLPRFCYSLGDILTSVPQAYSITEDGRVLMHLSYKDVVYEVSDVVAFKLELSKQALLNRK